MHLVVIGNGVAGISAARHMRKLRSDARITVISEETDHFYARTALMYIYMGHLTFGHTKPYQDWFWGKNRIDLVRDRVTKIQTVENEVTLKSGSNMRYDKLLIATGSRPRRGGWPGEDLRGVQGLYGMPELASMERDTKGITSAVVVGGGLIGVELAEMLTTRGIKVTMLVREDSYHGLVLPREEGELVAREIRNHGIDLRLATMVDRFEADPDGRVAAVVTTGGERLPAQFVGVGIGVEPNVDLARAAGIDVSTGVLVDENLRTSVSDVFAAGDCVQLRAPVGDARPVNALWYVAREQGVVAAHSICRSLTGYAPGPFFNSAKFFTLEWQTYGRIQPILAEGIRSIYFEHPDRRRAIRIQYQSDDHRVTGINVLGVRYRHEVCKRWLEERVSVTYLLERLGQANFDSEFAEQLEEHVVVRYNELHPEQAIQLKARRGWLPWMSRDPRRLTGRAILPGTPLP